VRLTHALNVELDQAMMELHRFGDQGAEGSRRIAELESLCKHHEEAILKLQQEKMSLELGIHSRNELIEEMATEMGLNRMGEDDTTRMMMMEMLLTALLLPPLRLLSKRKKIRRC
jgi:hypothetical protein